MNFSIKFILKLKRNLKSTNCLVESDGTIKLADYGLFPLKNPSQSPTFQLTNPPLYSENSIHSKSLIDSSQFQQKLDKEEDLQWISPETHYSGVFTDKSDIWSLGCIVFEMLTGESLYKKYRKNGQNTDQFFSEFELLFPQFLSANSKVFLQETLQIKPENRLSLGLLASSPFVKNFEGLVEEEKEGILQNSEISGNGEGKYTGNKSSLTVFASLLNNSVNEFGSQGKYIKILARKGEKNMKNNEKNSLINEKNSIITEKNSISEKKSIFTEKNSISEKNSIIEKKSIIIEKNLKSLNKNVKESGKIEEEREEGSLSYNARKRMEFEKNMMNELEEA